MSRDGVGCQFCWRPIETGNCIRNSNGIVFCSHRCMVLWTRKGGRRERQRRKRSEDGKR